MEYNISSLNLLFYALVYNFYHYINFSAISFFFFFQLNQVFKRFIYYQNVFFFRLHSKATEALKDFFFFFYQYLSLLNFNTVVVLF